MKIALRNILINNNIKILYNMNNNTNNNRKNNNNYLNGLNKKNF